jgi:hypothetical protein
MPYDLFFIIFVVSSLLVAFVGFLAVCLSRWRWEEARREHFLHRYHFDNLGNPEFYFNPDTGLSFLPESGNKAFPDQFNIAPPAAVRTKRNEPTYSVYQVPLEQYASHSGSTSAQLPEGTSEDALLRELKSRGVEMSSALDEYFNTTGGSKFQRLATKWKAIEVSNG